MKLGWLALAVVFVASLALTGRGLTQDASGSLKIGMLELDPAPGGYNAQLLRGARQVVERWNAKGGVDGVPIEVVVEPCEPDPRSVRAAVIKLAKSGVSACIAPLEHELAEAARQTARSQLVCLSFGASTEGTLAVLAELFASRYRATRIGLARDKSSEGKALAKALKKELGWPAQLVVELDVEGKPSQLSKRLLEAQPEVLVVDADPESAARFLRSIEAHPAFDTLLTPRALGAPLFELEHEAVVLLGRSPLTMPGAGLSLKDEPARSEPPGFGWAEGHEAMSLLLEALDVAQQSTPPAIAKALEGATRTGLRGSTRYNADEQFAEAPLALWTASENGVQAYYPPVLPAAADPAEAGSKTAPRPDATLGEPFGLRRTADFRFEEDTQWVLCSWGAPEAATIDDDLKILGLSTGGQCVLIDRIIKDELMARVLSVTSTKFRRRADGSSIPAESFAVSFATQLPQQMKSRVKLWPAVFAGDDEAAGGRSFGDHCEIYSSFMRRTIYEPHALQPPVGPEDLVYLDGSYKFGSEPTRDMRSERLRALIDAYAGSMALTAAHEVGHLAGLGHVTGDPAAIMNVEEGAGLDYRDAHFCEQSLEILTKRLELVE